MDEEGLKRSMPSSPPTPIKWISKIEGEDSVQDRHNLLTEQDQDTITPGKLVSEDDP